MPRVKQSVERVQMIDDLISSGKRIIGREALAAQLNKRLDEPISLSSLDKDLKYLRDLLDTSGSGVQLVNDPTRGYTYSEPGFSYFKSSITESDRQFLDLGYNLFDVFNGTELQDEYGQLIHKLLARKLSPTGTEAYIKRAVALSDRPGAQGRQWLKILIDAIISHEPLIMLYKSKTSGRTEKKRISPYLLKHYQGCWYLIAYDEQCKRAEKTNVYSLHSIQSIDVGNHKYHEPDFDVNEYFKYSLGIWHWNERPPIPVRLEFSDFLEEIRLNPIHRTQTEITSEDPGKLIIEITVFETPELERLILGYGNKVRVLSPAGLVERIRESAKSIAALYQ